MNLSPAVRPQLGQRIAQTHQHQVAAEGGVDGEIMVLHLQRDQVAAQRRRNPTQEVGGGERRGARFRSGRHGQGGDPGSLGICGRAQALLDEQAEHHGDGGREQGVLGLRSRTLPLWRLAVLAAWLRAAGVRVDLAYGDRGIKPALRAADRSGARLALVAGDRDIEAGTVGVKDLSNGEQVEVAMDSVVAEVRARLS